MSKKPLHSNLLIADGTNIICTESIVRPKTTSSNINKDTLQVV